MRRTPKGRVLAIVPARASEETIATLRSRVREAESGDLVGYACVLMYKGHEYQVEIIGETVNAPIFTRGLLNLLDDKLAALITPPKR